MYTLYFQFGNLTDWQTEQINYLDWLSESSPKNHTSILISCFHQHVSDGYTNGNLEGRGRMQSFLEPAFMLVQQHSKRVPRFSFGMMRFIGENNVEM